MIQSKGVCVCVSLEDLTDWWTVVVIERRLIEEQYQTRFKRQ